MKPSQATPRWMNSIGTWLLSAAFALYVAKIMLPLIGYPWMEVRRAFGL